MRHLLISLGSSLLLAHAALGQAGGSIAFFNMDKAFDEYSKTKSADQILKARAKEYEAEKEEMVKAHKAIDDAYNQNRENSRNPIYSREKQDAALAEAEKLLIRKRELETRVRQHEQDRKRQLEEDLRRTRKRLVEDIQEVVREYARSKGITAVFDTSGPSMHGFPTVIFADPTVDITQTIITQLNARP